MTSVMTVFAKIIAVLAGVVALFGLFSQRAIAPQELLSPSATTTSEVRESTSVPPATSTRRTVQTNTATTSPAKSRAVSTVVTKPVVPTPKIEMPGPLAAPTDVTSYRKVGLDAKEVIALTNLERKANGLRTLTFNQLLTNMAKAKTLDMIDRQYFEHVSPIGVDIGDLAMQYGYRYFHVGENLALGDFASSSHVVDGWMDSPGHRANILGKDFTEIGVYVARGQWKGREVWWAVQEFGKPMPNCPIPSEEVRKKIEVYEAQLSTIKSDIESLKSQIEQQQLSRDAYNALVAEYNATVDLYNSFLKEEKALIATYNIEVNTYNTCMGV